jgi:hypothetical protein
MGFATFAGFGSGAGADTGGVTFTGLAGLLGFGFFFSAAGFREGAVGDVGS